MIRRLLRTSARGAIYDAMIGAVGLCLIGDRRKENPSRFESKCRKASLLFPEARLFVELHLLYAINLLARSFDACLLAPSRMCP